jgi:hypothetical protein
VAIQTDDEQLRRSEALGRICANAPIPLKIFRTVQRVALRERRIVKEDHFCNHNPRCVFARIVLCGAHSGQLQY